MALSIRAKLQPNFVPQGMNEVSWHEGPGKSEERFRPVGIGVMGCCTATFSCRKCAPGLCVLNSCNSLNSSFLRSFAAIHFAFGSGCYGSRSMSSSEGGTKLTFDNTDSARTNHSAQSLQIASARSRSIQHKMAISSQTGQKSAYSEKRGLSAMAGDTAIYASDSCLLFLCGRICLHTFLFLFFDGLVHPSADKHRKRIELFLHLFPRHSRLLQRRIVFGEIENRSFFGIEYCGLLRVQIIESVVIVFHINYFHLAGVNQRMRRLGF